MYENIFELIKDANISLEKAVNKTPIFEASKLGENVYIKMENLQKTGSFKYRGAYNKINNLSEEEKSKGVIASSAGNHAQGVAKSATKLDIKSYVCIPKLAPIAKIEATRNYGAEVILVDGVYDDCYAHAIEKAKNEDLTFIHPFDDEYVIAGQGTIGLEILEQLPDVERIIVPIGGGGLISGIAVAVKSLKPDVEIIGVEAAEAASMYKSIFNGEVTTIDSVKTLADGIAVKRPGDLTFEIVRDLVDEIVLVSEGDIAKSILRLIEENKIIAEGAGAAAIAASQKFDDDKVTCCVLSGGNINVNTISKIIQRGLYETGRLCEVTTLIGNEAGQLMKLLEIIREESINILTLTQYAEHEKSSLNSQVVRMVLETKNEEQVEDIFNKLKAAGYKHYK